MMRLSDGSLLLQPVSVSVCTTAVVDWALQQMLMESSQHLSEAIESIKQSGEGTVKAFNEKVRKKGLPIEGDITFEPKGKDLRYDKEKGGYVDKMGNVRRKGPYHGDPNKDFSFEWDVELFRKGVNKWGEHLK